ncbi:MAG TPA: hypothetical protein VM146_15585 [Steroidobacteraceae bacterium]|nr:hypothetical protein [Steroidobacteraceae bacterium]
MPTHRQAEVSRAAWILDHFLALATLGSFVYVWWLLSHFDLTAEIDPTQIPLRIITAGTWSVIAAIVFWIRMYRDFFRHRPQHHAALWGSALFFGAHLVALVYFVVIWRPRVAAQWHGGG